MRGQRKGVEGVRFLVVCLAVVGQSAAMADVNLEWRASPPFVFVGETIAVGLYIASDNDGEEPVLGLDAILSWDAIVLSLSERIDNSPYTWLLNTFGDDRQLYFLNADCGVDLYCSPFTYFPFNDGDALYTAGAAPTPAGATPSGLLVATFVFSGEGPSVGSVLGFYAIAGKNPDCPDCQAETRVLSADPLGEIITGDLGSLALSVVPCGTHGDLDGDCRIGPPDAKAFVSCMTGPGLDGLSTDCEAADVDGDLDADLQDFAVIQDAFAAP